MIINKINRTKTIAADDEKQQFPILHNPPFFIFSQIFYGNIFKV